MNKNNDFLGNKKQIADLENVPEPVILYRDMIDEQVQYAINQGKLAYLSMSKAGTKYFKDTAYIIKKAFDTKYENTWHCIVGTNYGSYCSYQANHVIMFQIGHLKILLFKHA